jgi:hypothetical protein
MCRPQGVLGVVGEMPRVVRSMGQHPCGSPVGEQIRWHLLPLHNTYLAALKGKQGQARHSISAACRGEQADAAREGALTEGSTRS